MRSKNVAYISLLLCIALVCGIIENRFPPIVPSLPFLKLGLSNFVVLLTLLAISPKAAYLIAILKSILVPIFLGNFGMVLYSLPASVISLTVMTLLVLGKRNGIIAVSITGAFFYNLVQIGVAAIIVNSLAPFVFLPYLTFLSAVAGFGTGFLSYIIYKQLLNMKKL